MIREAIAQHSAFENCSTRVFAKGSYANNTNVRIDSDVDIAVECTECIYLEGAHQATSRYEGPWTPSKLRSELEAALNSKFPCQVSSEGSTAIQIHSGTARVDADVVPCFTYHYYFSQDSYRQGTKIFKRTDGSIINFPVQQAEKGAAKNNRTNRAYKKCVRVMKRVANTMSAQGVHPDVASYLVECLVYNVPDEVLHRPTWVSRVEGILVHVWKSLEGDEPTDENQRWLEVSECKYLFQGGQPWSRHEARQFAHAAWNFLELGS